MAILAWRDIWMAPYRAELKRPDLKGEELFLCGKVILTRRNENAWNDLYMYIKLSYREFSVFRLREGVLSQQQFESPPDAGPLQELHLHHVQTGDCK